MFPKFNREMHQLEMLQSRVGFPGSRVGVRRECWFWIKGMGRWQISQRPSRGFFEALLLELFP